MTTGLEFTAQFEAAFDALPSPVVDPNVAALTLDFGADGSSGGGFGFSFGGFSFGSGGSSDGGAAPSGGEGGGGGPAPAP
ncbi:hypothetical protein [Micavibrio aeruginosavorus]|uniref:hypothetical protein n=1 Tax=Micavibrio aeruginosavorus TaxID=349221 RepID=UPI00034C72AC|nr:hypothetical protein [Micavibrio aeruginosavorus]